MKVLERDVSCYGGVRLPTLNPPVLYSSELSPARIEYLRRQLEQASTSESGVYDTSGAKTTVANHFRSSKYCHVNSEVVAEASRVIVSAVERLTLHQLQAKSAALCEPLQFLQYSHTNSGHFKPHTDNGFFDQQGVFRHTSPNRSLTSILLLNGDFQGGELVFNTVITDQGKPLVIKPIPGTLIVFPSDIRFTHEVRPVREGVRYSVVGWHTVRW